jgi:hypothetical protein
MIMGNLPCYPTSVKTRLTLGWITSLRSAMTGSKKDFAYTLTAVMARLEGPWPSGLFSATTHRRNRYDVEEMGLRRKFPSSFLISLLWLLIITNLKNQARHPIQPFLGLFPFRHDMVHQPVKPLAVVVLGNMAKLIQEHVIDACS